MANADRHIVADPGRRGRGTVDPNKDNRSFQRAVTLLDAIADAVVAGRSDISLSDLSARTSMAKSTAHRLLKGLGDAGFVEVGLKGRYKLGPELIRLGEISRRANPVADAVSDSLGRLAALTGDTIFYAERRGTLDECMRREDGDGPFRNNVLSVGDRHPLGITAGSLAMLAAMPEDEAERNLEENRMTFGPETRSGAVLRSEKFLRQYSAARRDEWAVNTGWWLEDSWAVAVAIPGSVGSGGGASLSVATIRSRLSGPRLEKTVIALKSEAELLAAKHRAARSGSLSFGL